MRDDPVEVARRIHAARYPAARTILVAGSVMRGEATASSDLDLVVLFERVPQAYRESFTARGWPVEAFVHDPATLRYFFEKVDRPTGIPSLMAMVSEGVPVTDPDGFVASVKRLANDCLREGPPEWTAHDRDASRYAVTDMVGDLRQPRSREEAFATIADLYPALANHWFRSRGLWSAKGKAIPRALAKADPGIAARFDACIHSAHRVDAGRLFADLPVEVLERDGGLLFDGYSRPAPASWRLEP